MEQETHNKPGRPLKPVADITRSKFCGAKLRGKDRTCRKPPLRGKKRCRIHVGLSLSGTASPNYKTGKYSRYLPTNLRQRYAEFCRDRRGNDLQDEISLVTTHIANLIEQTHLKRSVSGLATIKKLVKDLVAAAQSQDLESVAKLHDRMTEALETEGNRAELWNTIMERVETRRRLVDTQRKYDIEMGRMLSINEAQEFMASMCMIIKTVCEQNINDRTLAQAILRQINDQFQANFAEPGPATPGSDTVH